jgi:hypothetical protein
MHFMHWESRLLVLVPPSYEHGRKDDDSPSFVIDCDAMHFYFVLMSNCMHDSRTTHTFK